MQTLLKNITVPAGAGRSVEVLPAETVTFKAADALIEVADAPQSSPPIHLHRREDEAFYILEGTFAFQIGDRAMTATAGWFMTAPKGVPHSYKNIGTTPAKMLTLFVSAGIENIFDDLSKLMAVGILDIENIVAVSAKQSIQQTIVPSAAHKYS